MRSAVGEFRQHMEEEREVNKDSMLDIAYYRLKSFARPITQHRRLIERVRYLGSNILSQQEGNDFISATVGRTAAVGKIGSGEIAAVRNYLRGVNSSGHCESWPTYVVRNLYRIAGVYPPDPVVFSRFCRVFTESLARLDVLAVWFNFGEYAAWRKFAPEATITRLRSLEPYYNERPWTQHLSGKRVLVVTPFVESVKAQFSRRRQVWAARPDLLPDFELKTLRAPLSAYVSKPEYSDWFAALDAMRVQMSKLRFDAAIVGAGAWSLPLVAHAKALGAWAIHLGGATQLLFGIRGRRSDTNPLLTRLHNESWIRPSAAETPQNFEAVEGGAYW